MRKGDFIKLHRMILEKGSNDNHAQHPTPHPHPRKRSNITQMSKPLWWIVFITIEGYDD